RSSIAPNLTVRDSQHLLYFADLVHETFGVYRIAGGRAQIGFVSAPKLIERRHRQFSQVLRNHRSERRRQEGFAFGGKADFDSSCRWPPPINADRSAFGVRFDQCLREEVLKQRAVSITASMLIADHQYWFIGRGRNQAADQP